MSKSKINTYSNYKLILEWNKENLAFHIFIKKIGGKRKISELVWHPNLDKLEESCDILISNLLSEESIYGNISNKLEDYVCGIPIPLVSKFDGHLYFIQKHTNKSEIITHFHLIRVGDPKKLRNDIAKAFSIQKECAIKTKNALINGVDEIEDLDEEISIN